MFPDFEKYIKKEKLFSTNEKLLLAVSGGVDSMVMLHLFQQLEPDFVVAHCNFKLRGAESDSDEIFLRDYCSEKGIEMDVKIFETKEYAVTKGISIEMAARELRYAWFKDLLQKLQFDYIATAHHQDDLVETMLINLRRGTGIRGLSGIQAKSGKIIRPLLFANRLQIINYAAVNQVPFQEDSSNDELVHQRNIIRHKLIPLFEEINPAFRKNMNRTAGILRETEKIYRQKIEEEQNRLIQKDGDFIKIKIQEFLKTESPPSVLFEILHPFGFNNDQVNEIVLSINAHSGKSFLTATHRLVKDRDFFLINRLNESVDQRFYIDSDCISVIDPIELDFQQIKKTADFQFSKLPTTAELDLDKLEFPLILKKWEQGEYFQPLGMEGFKKLSDFFIDEKVSLPEKENTWILYSSGQVVWIVGKRIDNRFKVTENTSKILQIKRL